MITWTRTGGCHRDPAICGDSGCCWMLGKACPFVSVENGLLTCKFVLDSPDGYWGDADAQDAAIWHLSVAANILQKDRKNFCKNYPWHPKQLGDQSGCGYDFICSECGRSFEAHSHYELESGECLG